MASFVHHKIHVVWSISKQMSIVLSDVYFRFIHTSSLLDQIPKTFANSQETETILAPAIDAGIQALKVE